MVRTWKRTVLEVDSMVVTWWIVDFFCAVIEMCIYKEHDSEYLSYNI